MKAAPSAYATRDATAHAAALGRIHPDEVHEFYHPFTMVEDVVEFVRVMSPGYGEMDFVYALGTRPPEIYTNTELGARFLRERYPEARAHRVPERDLFLSDYERGRLLVGHLRADAGPFSKIQLVVRSEPDAGYVTERYEAKHVWGSRLECHGIDTRVAARATGLLVRRGASPEALDRPATLFRGSYGRLRPIG